jgi:hypothetical protein
MSICLYLPHDTVGFMFQRPNIAKKDAHDGAGLRFEILKPFERQRITYFGKICMPKNPSEMSDPAAAFKKNPPADAGMLFD